MAQQFPKFNYSMKAVLRAGDVLRGAVVWPEDEAEREKVLETFRIANNWVDSHAYPMRKLRHELVGQARRYDGSTVARLKRMPSVRRKLRRLAGKLSQIQDLAGCRAILPSIGEVKAVITEMRFASTHGASTHELEREYDYINNPKSDGYRCHHMVFRFRGTGDDVIFDGRRIEVQLRSQVQHSWATAVEAVGMFRREDLKGGNGDPDWLRLFQLMSAEIALAEGCQVAGDGVGRLREIGDLNKKLCAIGTLEDISQAVKYVDNYILGANYKPEYYRIEYDRTNLTVAVYPFDEPMSGVESLHKAEIANSQSGERGRNTVLVEADSIKNLKAAYPNYFGDVQLFKKTLQTVIAGRADPDFVLPPQPLAPKKPYETPDLSWFKRKRFPGPKGA